MAEHLDVLVVGAGISGIGAGYYLQANSPDHSFAIFEGRAAIGGTWDLFRYPGIRSDSDMYTFGFAFRPWEDREAIASAEAIRKYLRGAVADYGLDKRIRFHHQVKSAAWSSADSRWTVRVHRSDTDEDFEVTCSFLFLCAGYYRYDTGYKPDFPGEERFDGPIIHPQFWPEDLDYSGKKVVIIGSGATAVTLLPSMAKTAEHVTMLQRTPTYIIPMPSEDRVARRLGRVLPNRVAYRVTRWKNVMQTMYLYQMCRRRPEQVKRWIRREQRKELPADYDLDTHFNPPYQPFDQRLCVAPDGDFFAVLRDGSASIVTDHIETFTETGIQTKGGEHLDADIIVSATGLQLKTAGGIPIDVDGERVVPAKTMTYKALMLSDVPNLALSYGYTNASWTLKSDLTAEYVCRLLNYMRKHGYKRCVPRKEDDVEEAPFVDFTPGYFTRFFDQLPKQGSRAPWRLYQNYLLDIWLIRHYKLVDAAMEFT